MLQDQLEGLNLDAGTAAMEVEELRIEFQDAR